MTCRKCNKNIEQFETRSGKPPTLCKHHYDLQCKSEDRRPARDRKAGYKEYDAGRKHDPARKQWKQRYARSITFKLIDYKGKAKQSQKREWYLPDQYATALFKSPCYYCGTVPGEQKWNGIDRVFNDTPYLVGNCVSACKQCNMMKRDMSIDAFINKCRKIAANHTQFEYTPTSSTEIEPQYTPQQQYNRSITVKLINYKGKSNTSHRLWKLADDYAISLFKSNCFYCDKVPKKYQWNGIDRIYNETHYIVGNCASCCANCNMMKKCLTYTDFIHKCAQIARYCSN